MQQKYTLPEDFFIKKFDEAVLSIKNYAQTGSLINLDEDLQEVSMEQVEDFQQNEEKLVTLMGAQQTEVNDSRQIHENVKKQTDASINNRNNKFVELLKIIPPPPPAPPAPPQMDLTGRQLQGKYEEQSSQLQENNEKLNSDLSKEESVRQEAKSVAAALNQSELEDLFMKFYYSGYRDGVSSKQMLSFIT